MKLLNDIFFIKEYFLKDKTSDAKVKFDLFRIKIGSSFRVDESGNILKKPGKF